MKKSMFVALGAVLLLLCCVSEPSDIKNTSESLSPLDEGKIPRIAVILPVSDNPGDEVAEDIMIGINRLAQEFGGLIHGLHETVVFGDRVEFRIFSTTHGSDPQAVEDITAALRNLHLEEFDIVIGSGFHYNQPFLEIHETYHRQRFIVIDTVWDNFEGTNIIGLLFRVNEAAFAAGAMAAERFEGQTLGVIGGIDIDFIRDGFMDPFLAGVEYMDKINETDTEVLTDFVGSFTDYSGGYALASEMFTQGAVCIYQAAGGAGNGVMDAAGDEDRWVIGVDLDQGLTAALRGDSHKHILTSTQKKWGNGIYLICREYFLTGSLPEASREVGMAEDCADLSVNPYNALLLGAQLETIENLKTALREGTLPTYTTALTEEKRAVWRSRQDFPEVEMITLTVNDPNLSSGLPSDYGSMLQEALTTEFHRTGRYRIIDRDQVKRLLGEIQFSIQGLSDDSATLETGRLMAAEAIVFVNLGEIGEKVNLDCKMVDVETGLMLSGSRNTFKDFEEALDSLGLLVAELGNRTSP